MIKSDFELAKSEFNNFEENVKLFLIIGSYTLLINYIFSKFSLFKDKKYLSIKFLLIKYNSPFSGGIIILLTLFIFNKSKL